MNLDSLSLPELFAAADFADKYLTPEEVADRDAALLAAQAIYPDYIRRHVSRYLRATSTRLQDSSLYRIGSHANLLLEEDMEAAIDEAGELTAEQRQVIFGWLASAGYLTREQM